MSHNAKNTPMAGVDLTPDKFPLLIQFLAHADDRLICEILVETVGVTQIPNLSHVPGGVYTIITYGHGSKSPTVIDSRTLLGGNPV